MTAKRTNTPKATGDSFTPNQKNNHPTLAQQVVETPTPQEIMAAQEALVDLERESALAEMHP